MASKSPSVSVRKSVTAAYPRQRPARHPEDNLRVANLVCPLHPGGKKKLSIVRGQLLHGCKHLLLVRLLHAEADGIDNGIVRVLCQKRLGINIVFIRISPLSKTGVPL